MTIFLVEDEAGTDDAKLTAALAAATAADDTKTHEVRFAHQGQYGGGGYYLLGNYTVGGNIHLTSEAKGRRATNLYFEPQANDQPLLTFSGRAGGGISNLRVTLNASNPTTVDNITGIYLEDCINFVARDFEVSLADAFIGDNTVGVAIRRVVSGCESITLECFNVLASMGVYFYNGDNIHVRDFSINANGTISGTMPDGTVPKKCSFKCSDVFGTDFFQLGPGSCQGGEHWLHCDSTVTGAGGTLYLQNIRTEQLVANGTNDNAALTFRVARGGNHGYESIEVRGCRNAPSVVPYGYDISGSLITPMISLSSLIKSDVIANQKPGSQLAISDGVQGGNLYAADTTARDAFFTAGVFVGQTIFTVGIGTYIILTNYMGAFGSAVRGTDYEFVPDNKGSIFRVEDYRAAEVTDTATVEAAIAAVNAASDSYVHTLEFDASRLYYFPGGPLSIIGGNVWVTSAGQGRRSTFLTFDATADDQSMVTIKGGHGGGFSNIRIDLFATTSWNNINGLHLWNCSSFTAEEFEIVLEPGQATGNNTTALILERHDSPSGGNDSITIQRCQFKAAVPVFIHNGDNIVIRDFDSHLDGTVSGNMKASQGGTLTAAKEAHFLCGSAFAPQFHTIGPGSAQKGHHLIHCDSAVSVTGTSMYLQNIRVEQMVANTAVDNAIVHFAVANIPAPTLHGYEAIEFCQCRLGAYPGTWPYGYFITGSIRPPLFSGATLTGGVVSAMKPGSQVAVYDSVQGGNLYAADATERDAFFTAGVFTGQQIYTVGIGSYMMLDDYVGDFASAVSGTDYEFITRGLNSLHSPMTDGIFTGPIEIGEDYLAVNDRAPVWIIPEVTGLTVSATTELQIFNGEAASSSTTGTIVDNLDGTWTVTIDILDTDTAALPPGRYNWAVRLDDLTIVSNENTYENQIRVI